MRHNKKGRKLGTDYSHTKAMKRSLVSALFLNDRIKTVESRAKEIRPQVDKVITWAKRGDLHSRRLAIAYLNDKELVREIFEKVAQGMFQDRPGGYTRIMKLGPRKGDNAPMVIMELVTEPCVPKAERKAAAEKKAATKKTTAKKTVKKAEAEAETEKAAAPAKKAPAKKTAAKTSAVKADDAAAEKEPAKKAPAKKAAAKKTTAKKVEPAAETTVAEEATEKPAKTAKKAPSKKTVNKAEEPVAETAVKETAEKPAPAKKAAAKGTAKDAEAPAAKSAEKKTAPKKASAQKTLDLDAATVAPAKKEAPKADESYVPAHAKPKDAPTVKAVPKATRKGKRK